MSDASARGRSNRRKGQDGERELAKILSGALGVTIKRRVRNHNGDSDLEGLEGFSVEVKKQAKPLIRQWWEQTVDQALTSKSVPVLFYKLPRREFRVVMSLYPFLTDTPSYELVRDHTHTIDLSVAAFVTLYRAIEVTRSLRAAQTLTQPKLH